MKTTFSLEKLAVINALVQYDPETGSFFKKTPPFSEYSALNGDGYKVITIMGTIYRAHILAWWIMTGDSVPSRKEIDHINRIKSDNRWGNLRAIPRSRNNHNSNPHKNNKSGVKGVSWISRDSKWDARIKINGVLHLLGRYERFEDAVAARVAAEKLYLGECPSERTGVPPKPAKEPARVEKVRWIDTHLDEFKANRSLKVRKTNTSGCPGVRFHKASGLWQVRIVVSGREKSLGYFKEYDEAVGARLRAEVEYFGKTHRDG